MVQVAAEPAVATPAVDDPSKVGYPAGQDVILAVPDDAGAPGRTSEAKFDPAKIDWTDVTAEQKAEISKQLGITPEGVAEPPPDVDAIRAEERQKVEAELSAEQQQARQEELWKATESDDQATRDEAYKALRQLRADDAAAQGQLSETQKVAQGLVGSMLQQWFGVDAGDIPADVVADPAKAIPWLAQHSPAVRTLVQGEVAKGVSDAAETAKATATAGFTAQLAAKPNPSGVSSEAAPAAGAAGEQSFDEIEAEFAKGTGDIAAYAAARKAAGMQETPY